MNQTDVFGFLRGKLVSSRIYPEFFPFNKEDRVVNIGCGQGPQAIAYAGQYKEMIGVDLDEKRLEKSHEAMRMYGVNNYKTICSNVEAMPLPDQSFDKAIAVDIVEHVQNPQKLCSEANRLLKPTGELLVTFPTMHDKFTDFVSKIGRVLGRKNQTVKSTTWNPDEHNQFHSPKAWIALVEGCGFKLSKSRASTLFPPLHLYGLPRFWYSNNFIHEIDSFFCQLSGLKNYGQALVCVFRKI